MKRLIVICLSFVCILTVACKKEEVYDTDASPVNTEMTIEPGKQVAIENCDLEIEFERLIEYSLCPPNVNCSWEGRAWVEIAITEKEKLTKLELITENSVDLDSKVSAIYDGTFKITLLNVNPIDDVPESPYEIRIKIEEI